MCNSYILYKPQEIWYCFLAKCLAFDWISKSIYIHADGHSNLVSELGSITVLPVQQRKQIQTGQGTETGPLNPAAESLFLWVTGPLVKGSLQGKSEETYFVQNGLLFKAPILYCFLLESLYTQHPRTMFTSLEDLKKC